MTVRTRNLGIEDGLSQMMVLCITRDSKGFLWIGTKDGLNRYDGYEFRVFRPEPDNPHSLSNNIVTTLLEDSRGRLWVGTEQGLNLFDEETELFSVFRSGNRGNDLGMPDIASLMEDSRGDLWIGTRGGGVYRLDNETGVLHTFPFESKLGGKGTLRAQTLIEDATGRIWLGSQDSLYILDHVNERAEEIELPGNFGVISSFSDSRGRVWFGTGRDLFRYTPQNGTMVRIPLLKDEDVYDPIFSLWEKDGRMWLGRSSGLYQIDSERSPQNTTPVESVKTDPILRVVRTIFEDNSGLLWLGSGGMGLYCLETNRPFRYFAGYIDRAPLYIYGLCVSRSGRLWMGTNNALVVWDPEEEDFYKLNTDFNYPTIVTAIHQTNDGTIWAIGGWGLARYKDEPPFEHCIDPTNLLIDSGERLCTILPQRVGDRLWVGSNMGLLDVDPSSSSIKRYSPFDRSNNNHGAVQAIVHDQKHPNLWIGFDDGGLHYFEPEKNKWTGFRHDPDNPNSLSHDRVISLYQDAESRVWIGTRGGGLNILDPAANSIRALREMDGLPNDTVYGILADPRGYLWLSTNNGLACLNPFTETFVHFTPNDGIQGREFNTGSYYQDNRGLFYFGGTHGLTVFDPLLIRENTHPPPVVMTDFKLFYQNASFRRFQPGDPPRHIMTIDNMTLTHRENVFSFHFSALDFTAPNKNKYAYKMDGFDRDWVHTGADLRQATYTNLDPGTYTFRVKAANGDDYWNNEGIAIKVAILSPLWQRWWAYYLYALALGLLIAVYVYRNRRQRLVLARLVAQRTRELRRKNKALDTGMRELIMLNRVAQAINREVESEKVIGILLEQVDALFAHGDKALFLQHDPHTGAWHFLRCVGLNQTYLAPYQLSRDDMDRFLGCSIMEANGVWVTENIDDHFTHGGQLAFPAAVVMTIVHQEFPSAFLILAMDRPSHLDPDVFTCLERFTEYAVVAVGRASMIRDLIQTQKALVDAAHQSGMAESAARVLHEMGNVFNSMQTDAQLLLEASRQKIWRQRLDKLNELLKSKRALLDPALQQDPQLKTLFGALSKIAANLHHQCNHINDLAENLDKAMQNIRRLLAEQHRFSGTEPVLEICDLNQVLRDALDMEYHIFQQDRYVIKKELNVLASVLSDRTKLRLILLSLLEGARRAMTEAEIPEPHLFLRTGMDGNRVFLEISDTGPSLPESELENLFHQGSTIQGSRSSGLHYAANNLKMMNGRIEAFCKPHKSGLTVRISFPAV